MPRFIVPERCPKFPRALAREKKAFLERFTGGVISGTIRGTSWLDCFRLPRRSPFVHLVGSEVFGITFFPDTCLILVGTESPRRERSRLKHEPFCGFISTLQQDSSKKKKRTRLEPTVHLGGPGPNRFPSLYNVFWASLSYSGT